MNEEQEYLIRVYKKGENIEHNHRLVLPEEIKNVRTKVLTKEKYESFKKSLNEYTRFINEELNENINFLEEQLNKSQSKEFELKINIPVQLKKQEKK